MEFLSAEWFTAVCSAVASVRLGDDRAAEFELVAGEVRSHLVIDAGRVVAFALGERPGAEIGLHWSAQNAMRFAWGTLSGTDAMVRTTMAVPASGAGGAPLPPVGLTARPEAAALPMLFGATLRTQFVHPGGPFGEFTWVLDFDEGRIAGEGYGSAPDADVVVKVSYRNMALTRAGEMTTLEALAGGEIGGDLAAMATLAAILESAEFQAVMLPTAGHCLAIATLGELRSDPAFQAGFARVMDETVLP
jgi:hypothetical protein